MRDRTAWCAAAPPFIVKPSALSCEDVGLVMILALLIFFQGYPVKMEKKMESAI